MSNPEFVAQKCDGCGLFLSDQEDPENETYADNYERKEIFKNHSEAHRHARAAGWYIADRDLCPVCREKQEVPE